MKKRRLALAGLKSAQNIVEGHISEDEDSDEFSDEEEKKPGMMRRFTIKEKIEILDKYAAMGKTVRCCYCSVIHVNIY